MPFVRSVIKCGSIPRLMAAIERKNGGPIKAVDGMTWSGVPVEQHSYLPENFVVITVNGEVTHIIDLDKVT